MTAELPRREEVHAAIARILREHCGVEDEVTPDTDLQTDLGLDSLGLLTLVAELENHYRANLDEMPEDPPTTVSGVIDLVIANLGR